MKKLTRLLNLKNLKELYRTKREFIMYIIFGIATTAVSYASYFAFRLILRAETLSGLPSFFGAESATAIPVILSWIISVAFAYVTNRIFVFQSRARGIVNISREAAFFFLARTVTLLSDLLIMFLLVDLTGIKNMLYEFAARIVSSIIIIILNYILSKAFVFKNKKQ